MGTIYTHLHTHCRQSRKSSENHFEILLYSKFNDKKNYFIKINCELNRICKKQYREKLFVLRRTMKVRAKYAKHPSATRDQFAISKISINLFLFWSRIKNRRDNEGEKDITNVNKRCKNIRVCDCCHSKCQDPRKAFIFFISQESLLIVCCCCFWWDAIKQPTGSSYSNLFHLYFAQNLKNVNRRLPHFAGMKWNK